MSNPVDRNSNGKIVFAWHVQRDVLVEPLAGSIEAIVGLIAEDEAKHEVPTRVRLLTVVKGNLPIGVVKPWRIYQKAWQTYIDTRLTSDEPWRAYDAAWWAYSEAWRAYKKALIIHAIEVNELHNAECPDCPWDGKTLFPESR